MINALSLSTIKKYESIISTELIESYLNYLLITNVKSINSLFQLKLGDNLTVNYDYAIDKVEKIDIKYNFDEKFIDI
ncbi:hypothetical protein EKK58_10310 [Candidatus Dependentiae bacterium]|nr:MAG: hypothetical protein EKK58_10310 [Candidatus Dependentiae bacterium]